MKSKNIILLGVAFTILGIATTAVAQQQQTIPAEFWGTWDLDVESCNSPVRSEGRLDISADRVKFYESGGPVRSVVIHSNSDIELSIELSGEGETWISDKYFRLSEAQKFLIDLTNDNYRVVRYRCP